ncbi:YbhB/YbcL family Raf kinase inhibitor-like protein [Aquimarina pacifica]|uniref:YbhB/YbcL family Raf kinase inhibitor-like protein n=1 Tax=Aquimarina pacifica TaxID=1296415 RepID=UPI00046F7A17|nr:YbhB/YbcL family Raf kinase inhibitor-like protein [Aquimarina pacifica]
MLKHIYIFCFLITVSACNPDDDTNDTSEFSITSIAIENGELLDEYKCEDKIDGIENSIPLAWSGIPDGTKSLAIHMIHYPDPDNTENVSSYMILWNIDTDITSIPYGTADEGPWYMGANKDGNAISYTSPCSQGAGTHEYIITIYALSETPSSLPTTSSLDVDYTAFIEAISTVTIIETATITFNSITS